MRDYCATWVPVPGKNIDRHLESPGINRRIPTHELLHKPCKFVFVFPQVLRHRSQSKGAAHQQDRDIESWRDRLPGDPDRKEAGSSHGSGVL